jgi:hypothetical protein
VLHNGDADLWCFVGLDVIVAPMMQRNHRDLHLVLGIRFWFRWRGAGLVSFWPLLRGWLALSVSCCRRYCGFDVAGASASASFCRRYCGLMLLALLTSCCNRYRGFDVRLYFYFH